jgi:hypothetical protein
LTAALVLAGLVATAPAACGAPRDITGSWPAMPSAAFVVPSAGDCFLGGHMGPFEVDVEDVIAADCKSEHTIEIVAAHAFTASTTRPETGDPEYNTAYATCMAATTDYLGGDWHAGQVFLNVWLPSRRAWASGDRHYSCAVGVDTTGRYTGTITTTLRGAIAHGTGTFAQRCGTIVSSGSPDKYGFYSTFDVITPTACTSPHDAEFTGAVQVPDGPYPNTHDLLQLAGDVCEAPTLGFLGETRSKFYRRTDLNYMWFLPRPEGWTSGDRTAQCYLELPVKHPVASSLRNLHDAPLPPVAS